MFGFILLTYKICSVGNMEISLNFWVKMLWVTKSAKNKLSLVKRGWINEARDSTSSNPSEQKNSKFVNGTYLVYRSFSSENLVKVWIESYIHSYITDPHIYHDPHIYYEVSDLTVKVVESFGTDFAKLVNLSGEVISLGPWDDLLLVL